MKAILVIDMPKNCKECKLTYIHTRKDTLCCCLTDREVEYRNDIENCPLKPMPEKKVRESWKDNEFDPYNNLYKMGWNACIEEIEK